MISEKEFLSAINTMHLQYNEDRNNSKIIGEIFCTDSFNLYDNSKLYICIMDLLRIWFPKDENGHCEIEFFCFVCDFGSNTKESFEDFYKRLIKAKAEKLK